MTRVFAIIAVLLSVCSLMLSIYSTVRADDLTMQALHKRERVLVERLKPDLFLIYEDFDTGIPQTARDAQTLDDLLLPLFKTVQAVPPNSDHPAK